MFDMIPSPALRNSQAFLISTPFKTGKWYPSWFCCNSAIMVCIGNANSETSSLANSISKRALGFPWTKNRFLSCSKLSFEALRIISSISSTAVTPCFSAIMLAFRASIIEWKWAATSAFSFGGRGTNCSFISLINKRVPSEPAINFEILKATWFFINGCV